MSQAKEAKKTVEELKQERDDLVEKVKNAFETANNSFNKSLYDYIQLGLVLLEARQTFGQSFYETFDKIVPRKQVQRYVKLATKPSCYAILSKKPALTDKDNLEVDPNIAGIKQSDLDTLKDPSMKKILLMKELDSKKDFDAVMGGIEDKYDDLLKKKEEERKKAAEAKKAKLQNEVIEGMTQEVYDKYVAAGMDKVLQELIQIKEKNELAEKKVEKSKDLAEKYKLQMQGFKENLEQKQKEIQELQNQYEETIKELDEDKKRLLGMVPHEDAA